MEKEKLFMSPKNTLFSFSVHIYEEEVLWMWHISVMDVTILKAALTINIKKKKDLIWNISVIEV